jgi:hypothetical protein
LEASGELSPKPAALTEFSPNALLRQGIADSSGAVLRELLIHLIACLRVSPIRLLCCDMSMPGAESPEMVNEPIEIPNRQTQDDDYHPIQD